VLDSRGFDRKHAQLRPAGADWLVDGDPMEGALVILRPSPGGIRSVERSGLLSALIDDNSGSTVDFTTVINQKALTISRNRIALC
jgi:hypothetical protein